ncbi:FAD-dependent oxidoreductase [Mariprofundus erugo]|uniref:FAD-dependent oxidoreductase n=1 Tax=Mariprofundus erugo TaxID=2528639 RepID=A0A5R9GYS2_9PROT|nr:FAD-dependent oxidoreductase [Mariprofundus erugo]TLS69027.1 FAD-dependent oxidoreductase [Mariprofundus erugo]
MRVGIVGGGINGLCAAWQLSLSGCDVTLFERGVLLAETSSASSKLLHGGLRYIENLELRLVREALQERGWWLEHVPAHTSRLEICLPVYRQGRRPAWQLKLGLMMYDRLAGSFGIGRHRSVLKEALKSSFPLLKYEGLSGAYLFYDGQMNEQKLGQWVIGQARAAGARLIEQCPVSRVGVDGVIEHANGCDQFDLVVNVAGPWVCELNQVSGVNSHHQLDHVRGSHIVLGREVDRGYLLEVPGERRVFFVLPYDGQTLIGTTEVRQDLHDRVHCSCEERAYLLAAYNHYFSSPAGESDIVDEFAGLRPLISSANDPGRATREYAIERCGQLVSVFGGKWTTARALAKKIVREVNHGVH